MNIWTAISTRLPPVGVRVLVNRGFMVLIKELVGKDRGAFWDGGDLGLIPVDYKNDFWMHLPEPPKR